MKYGLRESGCRLARRQEGGRVLVGQAVCLGHWSRDEFAAEGAQALRQDRITRGRAGDAVRCDAGYETAGWDWSAQGGRCGRRACTLAT